jgi:putative tricarboxylic transport membrane protein
MERLQNYDRLAALFFLVVGIFFAFYARSVEIGSWNRPGPGFLPLWGGLVLGAMSVALLLKTMSRKGLKKVYSFFPEKESWKRVLLTFSALAAYNLLLSPLGFGLTTFLFIFFLVKVIFPQTWRRTLMVAILGAVVSHLLFVEFLETQLPRGIFGF